MQDLELENRVLHQTVTETSSKLSQLQLEKQQLLRDLEQVKEKVKRMEELEKELHWQEKDNEKLAEKFTSLTTTATEKIAALERESQDLTLENQELWRSLHTLQTMSVKLQGLERENKQRREEMLELRRMVETVSFTDAEMAQMEAEPQELEKEELRSVELKAQSTKSGTLELNYQNVSVKNLQLLPTLEISGQKSQALQPELRELQAGQQALQQDHKHLRALLQHQSAGYEALVPQHCCLEALHGDMELEREALRKSSQEDVLKREAELEEMETVLSDMCDALQQELRTNATAKGKNQRLREELARVSFLHQQLQEEHEGLHTHIKELETSPNSSQLELSHQQAQFYQLKEQHQSLDHHCEMLSGLKESLEAENHHLMDLVNMWNQQHEKLLEQSVESKPHELSGQKQCRGKLNTPQKKMKEVKEKIMAHQQLNDPALKKKKHWMGAKAFMKLMKSKKEGGREHLQSTPASTPWPLGSSGQAVPSTSQPPQAQLEPLEATPSCSHWVEEWDTPTVPSGTANQHKKKSKDKVKSPAAHPALSERLLCWSSPDLPSSPEEPLPSVEKADC